MLVGSHPSPSPYGAASAGAYAKAAAQGGSNRTAAEAQAAGGAAGDGATIVTLSEAAMAAYAATSTTPDFAEVVRLARGLLNELLAEAERKSPLEGDRLALDMSRFDERSLHAIAVTDDGLFTGDERKAASLELERRFGLALSGPAAVSEVTGDYRTVYKAAAAYLDQQSEEQKALPAWRAARDAVAAALEALAGDPATPPKGIENDPVAAHLSAAKGADDGDEAAVGTSLARNLRIALDRRYREAEALGLKPSFDRNTPLGYFIDLSEYDARAVSAMSIDREGLFSAAEVRAAATEIRSRSKAALVAAYEDAGRSGDPTAFSRNIISLYSSMTADERQAAGWGEGLLKSAVSAYETAASLLSILSGASGRGGLASLLSR